MAPKKAYALLKRTVKKMTANSADDYKNLFREYNRYLLDHVSNVDTLKKIEQTYSGFKYTSKAGNKIIVQLAAGPTIGGSGNCQVQWVTNMHVLPLLGESFSVSQLASDKKITAGVLYKEDIDKRKGEIDDFLIGSFDILLNDKEAKVLLLSLPITGLKIYSGDTPIFREIYNYHKIIIEGTELNITQKTKSSHDGSFREDRFYLMPDDKKYIYNNYNDQWVCVDNKEELLQYTETKLLLAYVGELNNDTILANQMYLYNGGFDELERLIYNKEMTKGDFYLKKHTTDVFSLFKSYLKVVKHLTNKKYLIGDLNTNSATIYRRILSLTKEQKDTILFSSNRYDSTNGSNMSINVFKLDIE